MFSTSSPAVQTFIVYSAVLALKTLFMAILTSKQRSAKKVVANEEDTGSGAKVKFDDPDVERVRRAHRQDLENIPAFWLLGALYLTTGPSTIVASWLFRFFTVGRLLHTCFHAIKPTQPARSLAFGVTNAINWYMGIMVIWYYWNSL